MTRAWVMPRKERVYRAGVRSVSKSWREQVRAVGAAEGHQAAGRQGRAPGQEEGLHTCGTGSRE